MKTNTEIYLIKGKNEQSALLKGRAIAHYFDSARLTVLPNGKPVITQPEGYGISVSHSCGIIAVVITPCNVGIDIQERAERDNTRVKSFFHESESEQDFYDLWVKKEAYGKMTGEGIFCQKGKKLPDGLIFTDISKELSDYAKKPFSAVLCTEKQIENINFTIFD